MSKRYITNAVPVGFPAATAVIVLSAVLGCWSAASAADGTVTVYSDLDKLVAAAKAEGTLNVDLAPEYAPFLVSGFKAEYPWATLNVRQAEPGNIEAKWGAEFSAGLHQVDLGLIHAAAMKQFTDQNYIAQVQVPNDALLPPSLQDPAHLSHPMNQLATALIYNTKLISGGPATLAELTDPKWKGKLVFDDPTLGADGGYALSSMRKTLGSDDAWKAWLNGLKANDAVVTSTGSDSFQSVLRGDRPLCICAYYDYVHNVAEGAPLGVDFFNQDSSGITVRPIVAAIAADAPHPAMAALFVNWALSPTGGQKGFSDSGRTPAVPVPGSSVSLPKDVRAANFYEYMADYVNDPKSFNDVYKQVFK